MTYVERRLQSVKSISFDKIVKKTDMDFRHHVYGSLSNLVWFKTDYNQLTIEAVKDTI
jgi:hypothetical protein